MFRLTGGHFEETSQISTTWSVLSRLFWSCSARVLYELTQWRALHRSYLVQCEQTKVQNCELSSQLFVWWSKYNFQNYKDLQGDDNIYL